MPLCKLHAWFQNVLPTVYDSASLSLYEAMGKVMYKLNEVIDLVNKLEANEPNIENIVIQTLQTWLDDGTLADIINNDVLNRKADGLVVSVTSLGADPTGVNSSSQAFNSALSKAQNQGYKIVIPPGTYKLDSFIFTRHDYFLDNQGVFTSSGRIIYTTPINNSMSARNYYTFAYESTDIGYDTQGICFDPITKLLYGGANGKIWCVNPYENFNTVFTKSIPEIGHASTITSDPNFFYASESETGQGLDRFNRSDFSFAGNVSLPNLPSDAQIYAFSYNWKTNLYFCGYFSASTHGHRHVAIYDQNFNFIRHIQSDNFDNATANYTWQSMNWVGNYIGYAFDSFWGTDSLYGPQYLFLQDPLDGSLKYQFSFGDVRSYNECQGFTPFGDNGDFLIYSYSQQQNIQSFFKFDFKPNSIPNFIPIHSTSGGFSSSTYNLNKNIIVNSKSYPYPYAGTVLETPDNSNLTIPLGSDVIKTDDLSSMGNGANPFRSVQAAAAFAPSYSHNSILLCGDTDTARTPKNYVFIQGQKSITISPITTGSSKMLCPPLFIQDCENVTIQRVSINSLITNSDPSTLYPNMPAVWIQNCSNVVINNCEIGYNTSRKENPNQGGDWVSNAALACKNCAKVYVQDSRFKNAVSGAVFYNCNATMLRCLTYSTDVRYGCVLADSTLGYYADGVNSNVPIYSFYSDPILIYGSKSSPDGAWNG